MVARPRACCLLLPLMLLPGFAVATPASDVQQDDLVVETRLGKLRGSVITSRKGRPIYSFRGVRFAKPPIGNLRFQAPQALDPWTGVVNATEDGNACLQPYASTSIAPASEDCLFLNVYTTQLPCSDCEHPNRSVLFFIHPGGWYEFSAISKVLGPQYLLDQDIVLVTANYRLGALGLMSTGDGVLKGNYAMKDQVAALRWVNENIDAFGGNPSSVTIAGYSVGGASVFFHMLSPMTRGLFQRAISMSASIDTMWDIDRDPVVRARKHAELVGCPTGTSQQIADCMREKTAEEIAYSIDGLAEWGYDPILIYYPVIEPDLNDGSERYLDQEPYPQLLSGNFTKVPWMTGYTKDEFSWKALSVVENSTWANDMYENFETVAPISFMYERGTERSRNISRELKAFYLNNQPITNNSLDGLGKLYADSIICFGEDRAAKIISGISDFPVYFYRFSYQGRYSFVYYPNTTTPYGVVHHDELIYLFYLSALDFPFFQESDPEIQTLERLTTMWANFVKTGNPIPESSQLLDNVQWPPMKPDNLTYLDIGSELQVKQGLYQDRMELWDSLFPFSTGGE
ncbi:esterase E4-like [Schistocerca piceifrons]|uniref:esterase E4-like n=1 Tax=Schistocerca piceifrons TaxID=274613 RepID=UPI001F5FB23A|nr:esterase E4-like [Schistocerca piceifrons]